MYRLALALLLLFTGLAHAAGYGISDPVALGTVIPVSIASDSTVTLSDGKTVATLQRGANGPYSTLDLAYVSGTTVTRRVTIDVNGGLANWVCNQFRAVPLPGRRLAVVYTTVSTAQGQQTGKYPFALQVLTVSADGKPGAAKVLFQGTYAAGKGLSSLHAAALAGGKVAVVFERQDRIPREGRWFTTTDLYTLVLDRSGAPLSELRRVGRFHDKTVNATAGTYSADDFEGEADSRIAGSPVVALADGRYAVLYSHQLADGSFTGALRVFDAGGAPLTRVVYFPAGTLPQPLAGLYLGQNRLVITYRTDSDTVAARTVNVLNGRDLPAGFKGELLAPEGKPPCLTRLPDGRFLVVRIVPTTGDRNGLEYTVVDARGRVVTSASAAPEEESRVPLLPTCTMTADGAFLTYTMFDPEFSAAGARFGRAVTIGE